jgi:hypothetical protein
LPTTDIGIIFSKGGQKMSMEVERHAIYLKAKKILLSSKNTSYLKTKKILFSSIKKKKRLLFSSKKNNQKDTIFLEICRKTHFFTFQREEGGRR